MIPDGWGAFVDIHASYSELASRVPWISVISPVYFEMDRKDILNNEKEFVVCWDYMIDPGPKQDRNATVTAVYSEAIGATDVMLAPHVVVLEKFRQLADKYDAAFGHTPWMAEQMVKLGFPGYVLPVGWSPFAMGVPRWSAPKHTDIAFYGSVTGRRNMLVPYLKQQMSSEELKQIDGKFGRALLGELERFKCSLYIAHSIVQSFSTWRTWQNICTSTAMLIECDDETDVWPLKRNEHFIPIHRMDVGNIDHTIETIRHVVKEFDLLRMARSMYGDLGPIFTIDSCVDNYLIPASEKILQQRSP